MHTSRGGTRSISYDNVIEMYAHTFTSSCGGWAIGCWNNDQAVAVGRFPLMLKVLGKISPRFPDNDIVLALPEQALLYGFVFLAVSSQNEQVRAERDTILIGQIVRIAPYQYNIGRERVDVMLQ